MATSTIKNHRNEWLVGQIELPPKCNESSSQMTRGRTSHIERKLNEWGTPAIKLYTFLVVIFQPGSWLEITLEGNKPKLVECSFFSLFFFFVVFFFLPFSISSSFWQLFNFHWLIEVELKFGRKKVTETGIFKWKYVSEFHIYFSWNQNRELKIGEGFERRNFRTKSRQILKL